ncbi:MAG: hypothetical protein ACRCWM_00810 [Sarcina sp.]
MGFKNTDIDKIKLPENFDEKIKGVVDKAYKEKRKKQRSKKKIAVAAGLVFTISSGVMILNSEYVEATIQKITEIFKTRNYEVVGEGGNQSFKETYKFEHYGINVEIDIETNKEGLLEVTEKVDTSNIKEEDWRLDSGNSLEGGRTYFYSNYISERKQEKIYDKLWSGKDISKDIEYIKKNSKDSNQLLAHLEKAQEMYKWGISEEPFKSKKLSYTFEYSINGKYLSDEYIADIIEDSIIKTETYSEQKRILRMPEKVIGKKELELDIDLKYITLGDDYPVTLPDKKFVAPLKATENESAVKYIEINEAYIEGEKEYLAVEEMVVYPDGKIELLYNHGDYEVKMGYSHELLCRVEEFIIENEDGTRIDATGSSGRGAKEEGESLNANKNTWYIDFNGDFTGDTIKITPVIRYHKDGNIDKNYETSKVQELKPITIKVK